MTKTENLQNDIQFTLEPDDPKRLANLCGNLNTHLKQIASTLNIDIHHRGNLFQLHGDPAVTKKAQAILTQLYQETENQRELSSDAVHLALRGAQARHSRRDPDALIKIKRGNIKSRGDNQKHYIHRLRTRDINFGIGPAGTGKTYLAVACAVEALEKDEVQRIVLTRPAVEAGEKLGFLPGDLAEKVDPYLRPLYDALYEMIGFERVEKYMERNIIEVAPLAYMRGRTLNNAFIILDESQNTTKEQMKMLLTRIGFGSRAVITGDTTQIDLPKGAISGLKHAQSVLRDVEGIGFTYFEAKDVVRHTLVQRIVEAYDAYENRQKEPSHGH